MAPTHQNTRTRKQNHKGNIYLHKNTKKDPERNYTYPSQLLRNRDPGHLYEKASTAKYYEKASTATPQREGLLSKQRHKERDSICYEKASTAKYYQILPNLRPPINTSVYYLISISIYLYIATNAPPPVKNTV